MGFIVKRGIMYNLFPDDEAKKIIKTFEDALEKQYGSDAHYVYDVSLEKYLNSTYISYARDEVDVAFTIYLHTLDYLPSTIYHYLYDGDVNEELFNKYYESK